MPPAIDGQSTPSQRPCALVISGDVTLTRIVALQLDDDGWEVLEAQDGTRALTLLEARRIDVVLIDLTVPDFNGLALLRQIRERSIVPVLLLTPGAGRNVEIAGLDLGAEDSVAESFSMAEIAPRARAHLVGSRVGAEQVRHGTVILDLRTRTCQVDGREVALSPREFDLLAVLMRQPETIHTREALLASVWSGEDVTARTVDVHVAALRRKLGTAVTIVTMRGVGYRLADA